VAAFPYIQENPYQRLLYDQLRAFGLDVVGDCDFKLRRLFSMRPQLRALHFHWPQDYYSWWRGPALIRGLLSWPKLALFAARLAAVRRLGFTVVWTIHEVFPHERRGRGIDRVGGMLLARSSDLLIAHDQGTAHRAAAELRVSIDRIEVVPHASYVGVYPAGRPRDVVRAELGLAEESLVFLCFGHVRAYKGIELLLAAFASVPDQNLSLVIAGLPMDELAANAVRRAQRDDPRIKAMLQFVPDEQVAELYAAADVAVLPRGDGGTSGALVLALSLGLPVIAARVPDYEELTGGDEAGWLFKPGSDVSLAGAMVAAAAQPAEARRRGDLARARAERLSWAEAGERTATLIRAAIGSTEPTRMQPAGEIA
jgi:glycosyltransferase involved in cell wall biosynthesis